MIRLPFLIRVLYVTGMICENKFDGLIEGLPGTDLTASCSCPCVYPMHIALAIFKTVFDCDHG